MSGPSSRSPRLVADRDNGQMLLLGTQCAESHCSQVDFLPFKCSHCSKSYCQAHFKVEDHGCPEYEEYRHNRVAPDCPFCRVPVAVPPDQDSNIRMELHFEKECSVILGEVPPRPTPRCSKVVCNKVLFSPIACPSCDKVHCVGHRFPVDHNCPKVELAGSKAQASVGIATLPPPRAPSKASPSAAKAFSATASVLAADLKKSIVSAAASATVASVEAAKAATDSTMGALYRRQIRRRAKSERKSQLRGMRIRNERGILTEEESELLVRLEAASKDKDCIIM